MSETRIAKRERSSLQIRFGMASGRIQSIGFEYERSGKSGKSGKSCKSCKSGKSGKSGKSSKSGNRRLREIGLVAGHKLLLGKHRSINDRCNLDIYRCRWIYFAAQRIFAHADTYGHSGGATWRPAGASGRDRCIRPRPDGVAGPERASIGDGARDASTDRCCHCQYGRASLATGAGR